MEKPKHIVVKVLVEYLVDKNLIKDSYNKIKEDKVQIYVIKKNL